MRLPALLRATRHVLRHPFASLAFTALLALAGASPAQTLPADAAPQIGQISKDSVWVPTPERMLRRMLQLADTTADDVVMDLGSGDGRVPIYAAKHFGTRAIGVELEANLIRLSEAAATAAGVAHLTRFIRQDFFETDLSQVTVFALYISPHAMSRLKTRFLALKPGTRIASHDFTMDDWEPDESFRTDNRNGYLWVVSADVRGRWKITSPGDSFTVQIEQKHQMLMTRGERGGKPVNVIGARLRGTEISFSSFDAEGFSRHYTGRIEGSRMEGRLNPDPTAGDRAGGVRWSATRE